MIPFIIAIVVLFLWMIYVAWSSPLMRENEDGSWTTIKPERKFSELFNKKQMEVDSNDQRLGMTFTKPKRKSKQNESRI